jgi:alpha-glucosidase
MAETLRFWLDRGVDGFRMDVIHLIGKPEGLPDHPEGASRIVHQNDVPLTHEYLKDVRELLDSYPQAPTSVGEVALLDPTAVARYYGNDDELHMSFNFTSLFAPWDADTWRQLIALAQQSFEPVGAWPTWALSNHDFPRHRTRYDAGEAAARAAAVLLLTLRGTPFVYAGEEMGLQDAYVPVEEQQDPGRWRDGCRAPIPWAPNSPHGWAGSDNWLPYPPEPEQWNAETLRADPHSITHLYRKLIRLRHNESVFRLGSQRLVDLAPELVAWERSQNDSRFLVVVNMGSTETKVDLYGHWTLELSSQPTVESWSGSVGANSAVVLRG